MQKTGKFGSKTVTLTLYTCVLGVRRIPVFRLEFPNL